MARSYPTDNPGFGLRDLLESYRFRGAPAEDNEERRHQTLKMIAQKFSEPAEEMLQQLVDAAVLYCHADSAGVSLEEPDSDGGRRFRWVAVSGSFSKYLHGTTPRDFSPCGSCLDRSRPQHYVVSQPYYDFLGVIAEPILDGMLIPWESNTTRGTIWAVSHRSATAFSLNDYTILKALADLVSVAIRHQYSKL